VFSDDKALPIISNQKMNAYLKELGKFADIDESIPPPSGEEVNRP
jgi:hypothetical protein